jgi:glycine hydroxymethyltransferase
MLKQNDTELYDLIEKESHRQEIEIEMIASENYTSKDVMEANGSILTNKYSEGYPGRRYYAGQEYIDQIENLAIERAKELFGAEYVNVQPLSWSPANLAVYLWVLKPGDKVLWFSLDQGGHLSHGHPLNFSWLLYEIIPYTVNKATSIIDMDEVERLAVENKPQMIIAGFSAYPRDLDWKRFREIADKVWAILMADIAHIAWLVAGKVLENPVPYCDIVTTTTHKTLRGPRWGMIMSKEKYAKQLARAVFPWVQWWPHENLIAGKAVAFKEALTDDFRQYSRQVVDNARVLASELIEHWFKVISWWTDNHLVLVDVYGSFEVTGKEAEKALEIVGLSTNKNMIPYDSRKALDPSGIRIGTPAATTRGMKQEEMKIIARVFKEAVINKDNERKLQELKKEILELCEKFPIYKGK